MSDLLSELDDYRDHTTNPYLEEFYTRVYNEITRLNAHVEELQETICNLEEEIAGEDW